jgi:hypothetical protein
METAFCKCALALASAAMFATGSACSKEPAAGSERGACYGNGTCDEGLLCLSELCVRPPPADCDKVAAQISFVVQGNYAQPAERESFKAEMVTACKQAHLTAQEGKCIAAAKSREALSKCPKPLAMGSCEEVIAHVVEVLAPKDPTLQQLLADNRDAVMRECERKGITKVEEACLLRAKSEEEMKQCVDF